MSICPDIPSERFALSLFSMGIHVLFFHLSSIKLGKTLSVITGVHCFERNSVKKLAFSLQFRTNKLFTSSAGILGALHLLIYLIDNFPVPFLTGIRII